MNYKMQTISAFPEIAKIADFQRKSADVCRNQGVCHVNHIFLGGILQVSYNCSKFDLCRICVTGFGEGEGFLAVPLPHPPSVSSPKKTYPEYG